jgi:uncharacterized protein (TIGR01777 family)
MGKPTVGILLSGASGLIGEALSKAFADRGLPVQRLVRHRPASSDQIQWNPAATPAVQSDAEKLEGLGAAIHLSGANLADHRWTAAYKDEIRQSRVHSTRVLAETLARLKQPPKALLVASATGIYGDRRDEVLDEDSAPGTGFIADLCRDWESAANPARDAGIRVVHLRFGVVLTPGEGALGRMTPIFRLGLGGRLGSGRQWMSWISLSDAVAAILFILDSPALAGPVNFSSPHPVTNADFTRALARALHRPAILPVPAFALRLAMGEMADEVLGFSTRALPTRLTAANFHYTHPTLGLALAAMLHSKH